MSGLRYDIVTPAALVTSGEAEMVVVPGIEGEMGFLKGHAPLVSVLSDGEAHVKPLGDASVIRYVLQGGYVEVSDEKVIILADRASLISDIDLDLVRKQREALVASIEKLSEEELSQTTLLADRQWCEVQLRAHKS